MRWLRFRRLGPACIVLAGWGRAGVSLFVGHVAEGFGARIDALVQSGRSRREVDQSPASRQARARERAEAVFEERAEVEVHHPQPIQIIEPPQLVGAAKRGW